MRREAFRAFLTTNYMGKIGQPLSAASAKSYAAYAAQVERLLGFDLDSAQDLARMEEALLAAATDGGISAVKLNNLQSGLRAYARFRALMPR